MGDCDLILKPGSSIKPLINNAESKIIVKKLYGFQCSEISELNGYDDKNFRILVDSKTSKNKNIVNISSDGYVLKVMNSLDSKVLSFVDGQNSLMLYLASENFTCPRPVQNLDGKYYSVEKLRSGEHVVRLLEFIPGTLLLDCSISSNLLANVGKFVANFDLALQKFNHPAYDHRSSVWALDNVPKITEFLFAIECSNRKTLIENVVREFENRVLSVKSNLERGIIHGDFNEQNIIVDFVDTDWIVKGILDFGDSHRSCYLFELAVVMTYMIIAAKDLGAGGYVLGGYSTIRAPTEQEISLLKVCIAARMCQSLVMGAYTNLQDPENQYILTTAAGGWELLEKLWNKPENELIKNWKLIANEYRN